MGGGHDAQSLRYGLLELGKRKRQESIADWTDVKRSRVSALELTRPVVLAGHSWGGTIAITAAARRPSDVAALVLFDSGHVDYCDLPDARPDATIEELIAELREAYTIVIVTHNMQQASRVSDRTGFFTMGDDRAGYLVEVDDTVKIFTNPTEQLTEDYISGRFG